MKRFDLCLKDLLAASSVSCKGLARHLDISVIHMMAADDSHGAER